MSNVDGNIEMTAKISMQQEMYVAKNTHLIYGSSLGQTTCGVRLKQARLLVESKERGRDGVCREKESSPLLPSLVCSWKPSCCQLCFALRIASLHHVLDSRALLHCSTPRGRCVSEVPKVQKL